MSRQRPGVEKSKSKTDTSFEVYINEGEMYQIQEWVLRHKNIGTGGDLFGLWLDDHTAVVQFVLGPGKNCTRTTTSFFQDGEYLQEAGSYLTDKHSLCNIGQWHSHHRIKLSKPSSGDENIVSENMPVLGLNRYIVFIANITNTVTVNCFLFHYQSPERSVTHGQFKYLHGNSPLRLNAMVLQNTFDGLESFINPAMYEREMKFLRKIDTEDNDWNNNNIRIYTGNKEQFNDNISVQHGQHNMNSSRDKYAEVNNDISNGENVEAFAKNQDQYEVNTQRDQPKNLSRELISDKTRELQKHKNESSQGTQAEKAISYRNQGTQTVQAACETRDYSPKQNNYFSEEKTESCTPESSHVVLMPSAEKADIGNGQTMTQKLPPTAENEDVPSTKTGPSTSEGSSQNPNYEVTSLRNIYEQNPKEETGNQKPKSSERHMPQAESVIPSQLHHIGNVPTETQHSSSTAFLANKDHPSRQTKNSKRKTENCTPQSYVTIAYEIEQVKKGVPVLVQPIRDRQAASQQPPHKARHDDPSRRQTAHLTIVRSSPNNTRSLKEETAKTNDQVPKNKGQSTNLQTHQQQYEHKGTQTRTTDYGHKNTKSSSRISDVPINQPSQKRRSGQYDNVKDNYEKPQHYRSPYPESKIPQSENQSTLGERPSAPTGMIRAKESLHKEVQNEKTDDKTDGNNMPVGRVDPTNTSNERGQHSHVEPVSRRHTQTKTVVTYQGHESRKENGNQPSEKRRSGRYNVIDESSRYERGPNPQSENKLSQSREQATLNERPNTTSGTQAEESRHTEVQNKKRDKTKKKLPNLSTMCFGKTPKQISNKPHSAPGPEERLEERENKGGDVYETKL